MNAIYYGVIFFLAFLLTIIIERILLPKLKMVAPQPIYEGGPAWHMSKSGTPTMGGLAFLIAITISIVVAVVFFVFDNKISEAISLLISGAYALLNALVGIADDTKKLLRKENGGLTPAQKLLLQSMFALLFLVARGYFFDNETTLEFAWFEVEIGWIYYPIAFLTLVGITNCANLTDGVDGLASGVAFGIGITFLALGYSVSWEVGAADIASGATGAATGVAGAVMMGAGLGFLFYNIHPAKIFMGDTGSLLLGALAASGAFMLKNGVLILIIGGVYVIEGASVILQVLVYKATKKRLFKMAPLHHHLEKCGWSEGKICYVGLIATLICGIICTAVYYG